MNYFIKWKGSESGPFSAAQIKEMFETGKIGMLHGVREEGGQDWVALSDFFGQNGSAAQRDAEEPRRLSTVLLPYFTYALSGASFLSVYIYFALVAYCMYLATIGKRRLSAAALGLGTVLAVLGFIFFKVLYPQLVG